MTVHIVCCMLGLFWKNKNKIYGLQYWARFGIIQTVYIYIHPTIRLSCTDITYSVHSSCIHNDTIMQRICSYLRRITVNSWKKKHSLSIFTLWYKTVCWLIASHLLFSILFVQFWDWNKLLILNYTGVVKSFLKSQDSNS